MALENYKNKRNFSKTPEPTGTKGEKVDNEPIFVVQKHNATRLHYDFRLEVDGVLKSWAIPKGPSMDPYEKRLAVMVEDHPLGYSTFEGIIPEGEYGAGEVIVWDKGTYKNIQEKKENKISMSEAIKKGHIEIELKGKKLKGEFVLIKTAFRGKGDNWLLIKMNDKYADPTLDLVSTQPQSVISGKTIDDLKYKKDREEEKRKNNKNT